MTIIDNHNLGLVMGSKYSKDDGNQSFAHRRQSKLRGRILRKFSLLIIVIILTSCNIYFRNSKNIPKATKEERTIVEIDGNKIVKDQSDKRWDRRESTETRERDSRASNSIADNLHINHRDDHIFHEKIVKRFNQNERIRFRSRKLQKISTNQQEKNNIKNKQDGDSDDRDEISKIQNVTESKSKTLSFDSKTTNKTYRIGAKKPLIPLINDKNISCIDPAYMEFPSDLFTDRARSRGAILIHIAVVFYMFYCLAIVCDHYFLPSLEECSQRLKLSQDVAGATFMAAGSSAPELFTAILGVFIAKGDVGTGTIVGSAVFNILFVIGLCSLYTVSTELNWWPVARDSAYYTFTVLVLIMCIYDGEVTTFESFILLVFYGVYILIMKYNTQIRDRFQEQWQLRFPSKSTVELNNLQSNTIHAIHYKSFQEVSMFEAANRIIIKFKRLFKAKTRFRSAVYLILIRSEKEKKKQSEHYQLPRTLSMESQKHSAFGPEEEFWRRIPDPNVDGLGACVEWAIKAPLYAALHYTIPDCKSKKNIIMGITFLAAGTSVPDAYASLHVAKMGRADMAVSNSIGSNVFDILVGLALPWFVETAIVEPGTVSSINSGGLVFAVILLFLSLLATIYLFHHNNWTLNPNLGYSLLITYGIFLVISSAIEFNLFGKVNPPICGE
ncbi:Sodium/potassium/calcium exchanger 4 [Sarcoptes scabiei]|uniref:Sodium/potassium/calcium exchanger 4 n=1 Tax=Sarcoptes scabiei TaxID=52283 RepID=A0A834R2S5_SARSC|nr:Sodium/potassium/calcium exchanger 4 [Sarcoptes scabiei]